MLCAKYRTISIMEELAQNFANMLVLVTGGLGVMGATLVKGLLARGFRVRVLDNSERFRDRLAGHDVDIRIGDITDKKSLAGCFAGVAIVYHLAAVLIAYDDGIFKRVNVGGTRNVLAAAAEAGVRQFIHVSSASVTYPFTTNYSLSKRETEQMVRSQNSMDWTIVRPTLAYNENGGEEFNMFLACLRKYPVVPFIGDGTAMKRPVHCDDLMSGFLAVAGNPKAFGKIYAFSGGEAISIGEMAKLMLEHVGEKKPFIHIPVPICKLMARVAGIVQKRPGLTWNAIAGVIQDADLDNSEAQRDLGYRPMTFHEGLEKSYPLARAGRAA